MHIVKLSLNLKVSASYIKSLRAGGPGFGSDTAKLYFSEMASQVTYDSTFRNYPVQTVVFVGQGGWIKESSASFPYSPLQFSLNKISTTESEIRFKFPSDAMMVNVAIGNEYVYIEFSNFCV